MWLIITIVSYFINAGVYVADKFLLSKKIHSSIVYAFYVGIWSVFNFVILMFAPWLPSWQELFLDMGGGLLFLVTLIFWYKALHQSEATRVVPLAGALIPIFSLLFSFIFLDETLTEKQFLAFIILIIGGIMLSLKNTKLYLFKEVFDRLKNIFGNFLGHVHAEYRPARRLIVNTTAAALLFAAYYVLMKFIYSHQPFIGSFVWSRLGTFIGVLLILVRKDWRQNIKKHQRGQKSPENLSFFFLIRLLAALAFIMLNWAISLGSVALINSLQGIQFLFLIILVLLISAKFPKLLKEELGRDIMLQKIMGVVLVGAGLYLLTL
jgi:drug/metabolite transporter (DMT)-like permease